MTAEQLTGELVELIGSEIAVTDEEITPSTDLLLSGAVDSLGVVRVVDWIEQRLSVEIDPGDVVLEHFVTVEAMVAYLRGREVVPAP